VRSAQGDSGASNGCFFTYALYQRSSTGVHGAPYGAPNYAWGAPLRKGSQGCITNLSH